MFHDLSYGANNDLTSVVTQLAVVEMLGRMKKDVCIGTLCLYFLPLPLFLSLSLSPPPPTLQDVLDPAAASAQLMFLFFQGVRSPLLCSLHYNISVFLGELGLHWLVTCGL